MRLPRSAFGWLVAKEIRELTASASWWVLLVAIGPLVGVTFISAARTYAEASGLNGTSVGVGEAFSPLVGIWSPTFSACEVAAVFLLPFVAIRLVAGDQQSGALKIEAQHPMPPIVRVVAKVLVLIGAWIVASLAPFAAVLLWRQYGGHVHLPELMTVAIGHLLNAGLTIALAAAAAAMTEHPSTAAIFTLAVTVGTWVLNFIAAVQGGFWETRGRLHAAGDDRRIPAWSPPARRGADLARLHRRGHGARRDRPAPRACRCAAGCASRSRSPPLLPQWSSDAPSFTPAGTSPRTG